MKKNVKNTSYQIDCTSVYHYSCSQTLEIIHLSALPPQSQQTPLLFPQTTLGSCKRTKSMIVADAMSILRSPALEESKKKGPLDEVGTVVERATADYVQEVLLHGAQVVGDHFRSDCVSFVGCRHSGGEKRRHFVYFDF